MQNVDDAEWLARERTWCERASRGDRAAFSTIYDTFAGPLYGFIAKQVRNPTVAEDIFAESFRMAFQRIHTFEGPRSVLFWLQGIAKTNVLNARRQFARSQAAFTGWGHHVGDSHTPDLDAALDWPKEHARLNRKIARLSDDHRRAIQLRRFEEKSREDCAQAMGITLNNFDVTYSRAMAVLKKLWEEEEP